VPLESAFQFCVSKLLCGPGLPVILPPNFIAGFDFPRRNPWCVKDEGTAQALLSVARACSELDSGRGAMGVSLPHSVTLIICILHKLMRENW